jgi:hypothetical protein
VSPPPNCAPLDARQSANKVSRDYSHQYEVVGESNSQDFEDPIPLGRLGRSGRGLCSNEEVLKLLKDSDVTAGQVVDMLDVNMSLG